MNQRIDPTIRIDLNGVWKFGLDPLEQGITDRWFDCQDHFNQTIAVPGTIQEQPVAYQSRYDANRTATAHESFDEINHDFLVTKSEYHGSFWYMRSFFFPQLPIDNKIWFCLDAVHPYATIWINGKKVGEHRTGPLEPCRLDVTNLVYPGAENQVAIMISEDGRLLQGVVKWPYFSGIFRDAYITTTRNERIIDVQVTANYQSGVVQIKTQLSSCLDRNVLKIMLHDQANLQVGDIYLSCSSKNTEYVACHHILSPQLWHPDTPNLYLCTVLLIDQDGVYDQYQLRFGFRCFTRQGRQLFLNGKPIFMRGTGYAGMIGYPAPGAAREWYRRLIKQAKAYGFNYLRCHTYSMEPDMLNAADELGMMIQSELFSVFYETDDERQMTAEQCRLMLIRNRNHPSVACFVMGNEHDGTNPLFLQFRDSLCRMAKEMSPDTLVMDSDGISSVPADGHAASDIASAGLGIGIGGVFDMSPAVADLVKRYEKPYMIHEFGYPESFPQTADIPKYKDALRPFWLEHTLAAAQKKNSEHLLPTYVANSRLLHFRIVKKAIEDARKVDGLAGYGHWGFQDFVHESIGLVDLFLDDKGGSAEEFRQVNQDVVLAMTPDCDRMTAFEGTQYNFDLHLSNHSSMLIEDRMISWRLVVAGKVTASGNRQITAKSYSVTNLGLFSVSAPILGKPYAAVLEVSLDAPAVQNSWPIWFFPRVDHPVYNMPIMLFKEGWQTFSRLKSFCPDFASISEAALWQADTDSLLLTPILTNAVADFIKRGGKAILMPTYYLNGNASGLPMQPSSFGPMPSFAGTTGGCGTVIAEHPILTGFPHAGWCDYQWFDLIGGERVPHVCAPFHHTTPSVFDLDAWSTEISPIIRSIPNWKKCNNRAYLFEVAVGKGYLIAVSLKIFETLFTNPESAWLFDNLLKYATSSAFKPHSSVTGEQFDETRKRTFLISL